MSASDRLLRWSVRIYLVVFFGYLFLPLGYLLGVAFNASRIPTLSPWKGFTLDWFAKAAQENRMWDALATSMLIGLCVVLLSVPLGLCGALLLTRIQVRARNLLYSVLVSPVLVPGIVLGISTILFWDQQLGVRGFWGTAVLAQCSFISAYCMLIFIARLQRFDITLEEAALDLGASPNQTFWKVTVPYMRPALLSGAALAFLQSFESFTTTYFSIGAGQTFTLYIAGKVRQGVTPEVNAVAVVIVAAPILLAIVVELLKRREASGALARQRAAQQAELELALRLNPLA